MHSAERIFSALISLANSWDNTSLEKRKEADDIVAPILAANSYGHADGLSLAAEELRRLVQHFVDGDKHNGKA